MGLLDFLKSPDINQGIRDYNDTSGALLLDVRTPKEYREGHIPDSKNIPLQSLDKVKTAADRKDIPIFVYCYSGGRSRQAVERLKRMGYTNVRNLGGIAAYTGKVER